MKTTTLVILLFLSAVLWWFLQNKKIVQMMPSSFPQSVVSNSPQPTSDNVEVPVDNANPRITKKTFGLYVSPENSPVSPEKFTGYHTGVDYETFEDEKDKDVEVRAICDGTLLDKRYASGYGTVIIQSCKINNEDVTVIYGHLKAENEILMMKLEGSVTIKKGDKIGRLGKGYSYETDGERKHLHLGIHRGKEINIKGYVQSKEELNNWIDPLTVIK